MILPKQSMPDIRCPTCSAEMRTSYSSPAPDFDIEIACIECDTCGAIAHEPIYGVKRRSLVSDTDDGAIAYKHAVERARRRLKAKPGK